MNLRPRRYLPSIQQLLAFEAVMRSGSSTAAAEELGLTQSTVSRLVQSLEEQLGSPLFHRRRKRLWPSELATGYVAEVTRALNIIQHASMQIAVNPAGGTLSLAILPTFGTRWLAPRLKDFLSCHPGISLNVSTRVPRFSFGTEPFDAVIYYGHADWPDAHHQKLFDESHVACVAHRFLQGRRISGLDEVAALTLLHLENRPTAWEDWFRAQGHAPRLGSGGMMMDQFSMIIQAAIQGLGVALLPEYLAEDELREGRLVALPFPAVRAGGAYMLAWPDTRQMGRPLAAFREWLAGQCDHDRPNEP
ncbi:LysR family transcriptional regulator [Paracoccus sp. KR1-242]|uniref:LysR family transcriptional regulator n=1 Tax=Paracoccus sp. KR1-242 TaxID=3410028 RepID=UPI003C0EC667